MVGSAATAVMRTSCLILCTCLAALGWQNGPAPTASAQHLYLWTASADAGEPDFLAVLDVTERPDRYGRLVTTLPVPGRSNGPHHTEHEMPKDRQLFANGFATGQSFIFDLKNPLKPRIVRPCPPRTSVFPSTFDLRRS